MSIVLAIKTLSEIDRLIEADQGGSFRVLLGKVLPYMGDAFRGTESPFRNHMGASLIGRECGREVWYGFRWVKRPHFSGRMLRLFNRGHRAEAEFIAMLLMIGCQVYQQDENGNQYRISSSSGHFGGSGDGVGIGVPDVPAGQPCLLEFKTHSEKSFDKLVKEGVRNAKPEHFVQMQVYLRKMGIVYALYMAVNKNNDAIHAEIITLEPEVGDLYLERADRLIWMKEAPVKLNNSPGFWKCKFCDVRDVCHSKAPVDKNCRTCEHSYPDYDGLWKCSLKTQVIDKELAVNGCDSYQVSGMFK